MDSITVNNQIFEAAKIQTSHASILIIKGKQGFLGCGYFDVDTANRLNEPVAIVTGVKTYDDMLKANVVKVSDAALELGVQPGMSGEEALLLLS